jgi:ribosomal protein L40E
MPSPASPATPASPAAAAAPTPAPRPELTHGCVRCGARIPLEASMCEACNPLGLKAPAASQAHGTVFVGIVIVARAMIADVGPFSGSVARVVSDPAGLLVTVSVTNAGANAGTTTCRIDDASRGGIGPQSMFVETPRVEGGATVTFDIVAPGFGSEPRELLADCRP